MNKPIQLTVVSVACREPHRERGDNLFPRYALIGGMHETSNADWWQDDVAVDGSLPVRLSSGIL